MIYYSMESYNNNFIRVLYDVLEREIRLPLR